MNSLSWMLLLGIAVAFAAQRETQKKKRKPIAESKDDDGFVGFRASYISTSLLVNGSEKAAWHTLKQVFAEPYVICPKVRLEDIVHVKSLSEKEIFKARNRIKSRHVDFLVVDNKWTPVLAVEVDGSSHWDASRVQRDVFVNSVLHGAGIPVAHLKVGQDWAEQLQSFKQVSSG